MQDIGCTYYRIVRSPFRSEKLLVLTNVYTGNNKVV